MPLFGSAWEHKLPRRHQPSVITGLYNLTIAKKTMERGVNICPNWNPKWKVQPCLTADQTDQENTLVGNTEKLIGGKPCPNLAQKRPSALPAPQTPQDP